jgi:chromosome segregation ATPase
MAKSFKEFGKKAEQLIEQGRVVDQKIQSCQARVASSNGRVATARKQLVAASETDEAGNPVGDVEHAKAELSMAENQLAASQRALSSARGDANRVRQQKNDHVQEIEKHNQVERSNLEKLRRLRLGAFGADSVALTDGMAQRLNEAEDARVALLRSMGIDATPDYVAMETKVVLILDGEVVALQH